MSGTPDGYILKHPARGTRLLVREEYAERLARAGLETFPAEDPSGSVDDYSAGRLGRGALRPLQLPGAHPLLVKHYRRGGLLGRIRGSLYFGCGRTRRELAACLHAEAHQLPVVRLAALWEQRVQLLFYRHAAAVEELPGAEDLFAFLVRTTPRESPAGTGGGIHLRERVLREVADVLAALHGSGVMHRDLNLGNILVSAVEDDGSADIRVIDFDRAVIRSAPLGRKPRIRALARMKRSLVKLSPAGALPLSRDEELTFFTRYWQQAGLDGAELERMNALTSRRCRREIRRHRSWWQLFRHSAARFEDGETDA